MSLNSFSDGLAFVAIAGVIIVFISKYLGKLFCALDNRYHFIFNALSRESGFKADFKKITLRDSISAIRWIGCSLSLCSAIAWFIYWFLI